MRNGFGRWRGPGEMANTRPKRPKRETRPRGAKKRVQRKICSVCLELHEMEEMSIHTQNCCWRCCRVEFSGLPSPYRAILPIKARIPVKDGM